METGKFSILLWSDFEGILVFAMGNSISLVFFVYCWNILLYHKQNMLCAAFFNQICVVKKLIWSGMSHWLLVYPKILSNFGARWYVVSSLSHLALLFCKISINASGLPSWHCYSYCKVTPRRRLYCKAYVALAPHWRQGLFSCTVHPLSRFSAILLSVATSWQHQQALGTGAIQNRAKYALTRQKPKLYLLRLKVAMSHLEREDRKILI